MEKMNVDKIKHTENKLETLYDIRLQSIISIFYSCEVHTQCVLGNGLSS